MKFGFHCMFMEQSLGCLVSPVLTIIHPPLLYDQHLLSMVSLKLYRNSNKYRSLGKVFTHHP